MTAVSAPPRSIFRHLTATPVIWAAVTFLVYFWYSQFIGTIGWNAIELIIAQHLIDHGVYATSLDYPSALGWRPAGSTLLITGFRLLTSDPMLIYRTICALSLSTLVGTLFLSARMLWGRIAAHSVAFLTFTCPALTSYLIQHTHSYSHLVGLLALGPAIYLSLRLLKVSSAGRSESWRWQAGTGVAWGLAYLCRSELQLFWAVVVVLLAWLTFRHRLPWRPLLANALGFSILFISYNLVAESIARRDGLIGRKTIYTMYASQGWADPPAGVGPDIEADGFVYAEKLYGTVEANHESVLRAIARNPAAFLRRVRLNAQNFYHILLSPGFSNPWCIGAAIIGLGFLLTGRAAARERPALLFLLGIFAATHFTLIFHIDARYLTVGIPALLLLAGYGIARIAQPIRRWPRVVATTGAIALIGALLFSARGQMNEFRTRRDNMVVALATIKALAAEFRSHVPQPVLTKNREVHLKLIFPASMRMVPEDGFMLPYFAHTAWVTGTGSTDFPRDKLYGFRNCEDDYVFMPKDHMSDLSALGRHRIVSECDNPELGHYYLLQMTRDLIR